MIKVLHCPDQIGGNPGILSKYENLLGLYSTCFSECANRFSDVEYELISSGYKNESLLNKEFSKLRFLIKSSFESGVVHFNNGRTLAPHFGESIHPRERNYPQFIRKLTRFYANSLFGVELCLWRFRRKAIFITFQGSDARETKCFENEHLVSGLASKILKRSGLAVITQFAKRKFK